MPQEQIIARLEEIRINMMAAKKKIAEEKKSDEYEEDVALVLDHIYAIEDALVTISWALSRMIDPLT